jgi:hypothetical protein
MKEVFESDLAWLKKDNVVQWFALAACGLASLWPWIPLIWFYLINTSWTEPLALLILFSFMLSGVWSCFWVRVFSKWWPF